MAGRKKSTDEDLLSEEELRQLEERAGPRRSVGDYDAELNKLSQGDLKPVYIKVWSRRGAMNRILGDCPAPFRRGEAALVVGKAHSVQMGDHEEPVFTIKYGDTVNKDYPQTVALPVECYVWTYIASDVVGMQYVERPNKQRF